MISRIFTQVFIGLILLSCNRKQNDEGLGNELASLDLKQGEIALCGSGDDQFGSVDFALSCSEKVAKDFNLALALLHSFEYVEAEKVFSKVINQDPHCVMAYWGAAMCSFHPLWEKPSPGDLQKGSRIIALARSLENDKSTKEWDYLEAIATIYNNYEKVDHRSRLLDFEKASEKVFLKYPEDSEAAIFYSLALCAAADPSDKSFRKQKKAGEILEKTFVKHPDHPGIAHYIIHTYDYPELAELALPAARKYASIAAASAHAQHMPSHIFTRLGLWEEDIQSNIKSVSAAVCYAENMGLTSHWDEELHGMDYLLYAYLQQGDDAKAREQIEYLKTIKEVFPQNFKVAYAFAAMPARYSLERKAWTEAAQMELHAPNFPWENFPWEKANVHFARILGAVHTKKLPLAKTELDQLRQLHKKLEDAKDKYKANLVLIQIKSSEAWIKFAEGEKQEAVILMADAAEMEDMTEKHPVTPGEIIPARELLGDLYLELGRPGDALTAYEANLKKHPNRFNGLYGAAQAAQKLNDLNKAGSYYEKLINISAEVDSGRSELTLAKNFLRNKI